jgi:hypothetical protein
MARYQVIRDLCDLPEAIRRSPSQAAVTGCERSPQLQAAKEQIGGVLDKGGRDVPEVASRRSVVLAIVGE